MCCQKNSKSPNQTWFCGPGTKELIPCWWKTPEYDLGLSFAKISKSQGDSEAWWDLVRKRETDSRGLIGYGQVGKGDGFKNGGRQLCPWKQKGLRNRTLTTSSDPNLVANLWALWITWLCRFVHVTSIHLLPEQLLDIGLLQSVQLLFAWSSCLEFQTRIKFFSPRMKSIILGHSQCLCLIQPPTWLLLSTSVTSRRRQEAYIRQLEAWSHSNFLWYSWCWCLFGLQCRKVAHDALDFVTLLATWVIKSHILSVENPNKLANHHWSQ